MSAAAKQVRRVSMADITHIAARQVRHLFYLGVFKVRTIRKAGEPKVSVEISGEIAPNLEVIVSSHEQLTTLDQDVFLTVLAMARTKVFNIADRDDHLMGGVDRDGNHVPVPDDKRDKYNAVTKNLSTKPALMVDGKKGKQVDLSRQPVLHYEASFYEMAQQTAYRKQVGNNDYNKVSSSLKKLAGTTMTYILRDDNGKRLKEVCINLLSYAVDYENNRVAVNLNPIIAHSVWSDEADYVYTDLRERSKLLKNELSRLLHDHLGGRVRHGEKDRRFVLDNLMEHFYGKSDNVSESTIRKRRKAIKDALVLISESIPAWTVTIKGTGSKATAHVTRKAVRKKK